MDDLEAIPALYLRIMARSTFLLVAMASLTGCVGRYSVMVAESSPADSGHLPGDGVAEPFARYQDYLDTLSLPTCPVSPYADLVVTTAAFENDGGTTLTDPLAAGAELSFYEAVWIARNRPGVDVIRFGPRFSETTAPRLQVRCNDILTPFPNDWLTDVCIDGRGHEVVFEWDWGSDDNVGRIYCEWRLGPGSSQIGVSIINPWNSMAATQATIAGCRFGGDGHTMFRASSLILSLANAVTFGPGNILESGSFNLGINGRDSHIFGNHFGYDPVTGQIASSYQGFMVQAAAQDVIVEDNNVMALIPFSTMFANSTSSLTAHHNWFGPYSDAWMGSPQFGAIEIYNGKVVLGPGNTITGSSTAAIHVWGAAAQLTLTENSITNNLAGIVYESPVVTPPTLLAITAGQATGSCSQAGNVELFADPGNQGQTFLERLACDATATWQSTAPLPSGRNLTATLTDPQGRTSSFSAPLAIP